MSNKPDFVEDEHLEYLDDLRDSGETNMFGAGAYLEDEAGAYLEDEAGAYLEDEFNMNKHDARLTLSYWMGTFSERHPN